MPRLLKISFSFHRFRRLLPGLALVLTTACPSAAETVSLPSSASPPVAEAIRLLLESGGRPARIRLGPEPVLASSALPDFYHQRFFEPAWTEEGRPRPQAFELVDFLRRVGEEGLEPHHYHLSAIERYLEELEQGDPESDLLADLDLLLSDAFLVVASHLRKGRIDPETIDPEWQARRAGYDPLPVLHEGLHGGGIRKVLEQQMPAAPEYAGLRQALEDYRRIEREGGWPALPAGPTLRPEERSPRIPLLRQRLAATGDLSAEAGESADPEVYDPSLAEAVRQFQVRHGLNPDGAVGKATLAALNVPAAERVRQIEVNLERWRWLPRDLGERYLLVNIAAFELYLVEAGSRVLEMKVVVGKPYRRTPVFSGLMTYLVLNPYWNIPRRIAVVDLLPQFRRDPGAFARLGIRVFRGWGAEAREIDPPAIAWDRLTRDTFPFHLRQEPGPANALGRVKFMFPNTYDVYLHDTPARELFLKETRTFSSGCIRLEKPLELTLHLLRETPLGAPGALEKALAGEKALSVKLPAALPVHLLYWTAWMDGEGALHFRPDIYDRDRALDQALSTGPPTP